MRASLTRFIQLSIICTLFTVNICSGFNLHFKPRHHTNLPSTQINKSADEYLQLATTAIEPDRQLFQLQAVRRLLHEQKLTRAQQVLSTISTEEVSPDLKAQKQILAAEILFKDNRPLATVGILSQININGSLSNNTQRDFHLTLAKAQEKAGNIIASIEQRNQLEPFLKNFISKQKNQYAVWLAVQKLSSTELHTLLTQPLASNIRAWLELAQIMQSDNEPTHIDEQLNRWHMDHPKHPGHLVLKKQNEKPFVENNDQHNKIYLLLPLHGKFSEQGQAIRNGFMAAYYSAKKQQQNPATISILDTSEGDIITHYRKAIQNGADFVVGPLTKANIERLITSARLTKPTLVLNSNMPTKRGNLFQFGLSQHQEATQTAQHAFEDGHRHAIVIAPDTAWGKSVSENFIQHWQELGGTLTDTLAYNNISDLSPQLRNLLQVKQSESRASEMKKLLGEDIRFVARRREDVECIFLVANTDQARAIMPLLKFYYAGNLPVYATSLVYSGAPNKRRDNDLENLQFADMPWVLGQLPPRLQQIRKSSETIWPESFNQNPKFYALGVDAFQLSNHLQNMQMFPSNGVSGATGTLYLGQQQHIIRRLEWAQFRGGEPQLLR